MIRQNFLPMRLALAIITVSLLGNSARAMDNIIRPYQSIRSSGMGGVVLTTGLYDDNFFGNPARVTQNPKWKVQLPDFLIETNSGLVSTINTLLNSTSNIIPSLASTAGTNNHGRIQSSFPSVYFPDIGKKMSLAVGFLASAQFDLDLRRSYQINPAAIVDIGPAITVGRKFLDNQVLSLGLTTHVTYRLATNSNYSLIDFIKGKSLNPTQAGGSGDGTHLDFDLGSTYILPWKFEELELSAGAVINNILGGKYSNLGLSLMNLGALPKAQPRSFGFGLAAHRTRLWKFSNANFALEFRDFGNNVGGSFFRTIHLGGEVHYSVAQIRLGFNQGYISAGLGFDLKALQFDFATYGEEMSLNAGGLEDRRYAVLLGFAI